jgi:branched-chain amino acid aminotransferase
LRHAAGLEPRGVYTVARTYDATKAVLLDSHLDRLEESSRLEGTELRLKREEIRAALRELLENAGNTESRFRITIPFHDTSTVYLALEPLLPLPRSLKRVGVIAATYRYQRDNPRAKSNAWEPLRSRALASLPAGVFEGLLVDEDEGITEGFTSNFYAIQSHRLRTADDGILRGISRRILLEVLPDNLTSDFRAVTLKEVAQLDEAFLTSSSRGVVPIIRIDGMMIGDGLPGERTQELIQRYDDYVATNLEPI